VGNDVNARSAHEAAQLLIVKRSALTKLTMILAFAPVIVRSSASLLYDASDGSKSLKNCACHHHCQ
jgi:hypothetical protein